MSDTQARLSPPYERLSAYRCHADGTSPDTAAENFTYGTARPPLSRSSSADLIVWSGKESVGTSDVEGLESPDNPTTNDVWVCYGGVPLHNHCRSSSLLPRLAQASRIAEYAVVRGQALIAISQAGSPNWTF